MMTQIEMFEKVKNLVISKLDSNNEAQVTAKATGQDFFFKSYDNGQTWHLYQGCDLVVGDVTFDYAVHSLIDVGYVFAK